MNCKPVKGLRLITVAGLLAFASLGGTRAHAQAPPGPLPQTPSKDAAPVAQSKAPLPNVPRRKNLAGTWRLNTDESDDPGKKFEQARSSRNGGPGGRRSGGMGGGWPGGIGGRGRGGGRGMGGGESDSERQKMHLFIEPAQRLTVSQKEPVIDVTDDSDRKFVLFTDNRKIEKSKDKSREELSAKWEEYRLVADGKDPRGNKYQRCYEVLEGNRQLRETLFLKVGRNNTEISIRYVYDLVEPAESQAPPAS